MSNLNLCSAHKQYTQKSWLCLYILKNKKITGITNLPKVENKSPTQIRYAINKSQYVPHVFCGVAAVAWGGHAGGFGIGEPISMRVQNGSIRMFGRWTMASRVTTNENAHSDEHVWQTMSGWWVGGGGWSATG